MTYKILVADDEANITDVCTRYLDREGYYVISANDGQEAMDKWREERPDLIVLDLMMPKLNGWQVCERIRLEHDVPVVMLTARGEEMDRLMGLTMGADDYLTKPFSPRELVLRIKAILRRMHPHTLGLSVQANATATDSSAEQTVAGSSTVMPALNESALQNASASPTASAIYSNAGATGPDAFLASGSESDSSGMTFPGLTINPLHRSVVVEGRPVELTVKEFELLWLLARHPDRVFSRNQLLDHIWSTDYYGDTTTITVHISRLRDKIEPVPSQPRYIKTVWGIGYKFEGRGN